jgi:hypothetical protein
MLKRIRRTEEEMESKIWYVLLVAAVAAAALVGCGGEQTTPVEEGDGETYSSEVLDTSYDGALSVSNQLALGTMQLEDTENAITPEQATALLPLWQALQGGVTAEAEVNAVLKQIEGAMTQEQLEAIASLQLIQEDLRAWMDEQGMPSGFPGIGGDMTEEEREAVRATRQAESGGQSFPGGGEVPPEMATRRAEYENVTEEEREALRATMQAGGGSGGSGGRGGAGGRQLMFLLNPLIELLEARAGEM